MKRMLWFLAIFLVPLLAYAQPDSLWSRNYLHGATTSCYTMDRTQDGGYILAGTEAFNGVFLLRTNSSGDSLWARYYMRGTDSRVFSVISTFDGGFVLAFYSPYGTADGREYRLLKANSLGDSLWSKTYRSGSLVNLCYAAVQTADSGFALTGYINQNNDGQSGIKIWLVKTNAQGDSLWSRLYPSSSSFYLYSSRFIHQMPDGGYLLGLNGGPQGGMGILRVNAAGDSITSRGYTQDNSLIFSVTPTHDGGFLFVGRDGDWGGPGWRLVRTDSDFNELWTTLYPRHVQSASSEPHAAVETADGGFVIAGSDSGRFCMIRLNHAGVQLWTRHYGQEYSAAWDMVPTATGGFAMAGHVYFGGNSERYIELIATGPDNFCEITPAFLAFDSVDVGDNEQLPVWLNNYTDSTVFVGVPALSDTVNFSVDRYGPQVVPAGQTTLFLVNCHPRSAGSLAANLAFNIPYPLFPSTIAIMAYGLVHAAVDRSESSPRAFRLDQNYPNPFNPETRISFDLPRATHTTLEVFDITGRTVATLINGMTESGHHDIVFNGNSLPSGVYFYRLQSGNYTVSRKMLLLK